MAANRETVRDAVATLLEDGLTGTGNPVQAVYNCQVGDFDGQSPVVVVSSGGSARPAMTFQGNRATFWVNVHVFVLYSDEGDWGEDDAEDRLDLIEKEIAGIVETNRGPTDYWQKLAYGERMSGMGRTQTGSVVVGGLEYRTELIEMQAEVF